jgi:hypothetical protein
MEIHNELTVSGRRSPRKVRIHPRRVHALYQYLKESRDYSLKDIAKLLDKDPRSVSRYIQDLEAPGFSPIPWAEWAYLCTVFANENPNEFRIDLQ